MHGLKKTKTKTVLFFNLNNHYCLMKEPNVFIVLYATFGAPTFGAAERVNLTEEEIKRLYFTT